MKTRLIGFLVFLAFLIAWVVVCDGAAIPGTIVAAKITTGDTANTFSIGDTEEMGGTPKQVADIAARDALPADRRTEGMVCWVINESNEYRLVGGILNANWALSQAMTNTPLNVFTNDGTYVHLYGTVMNVDAPYAFGRDGSFYQGTNATDGLTIAPGSMHVLGAVSFTDSNQPTSLFIDSAVDDNTLNENFANIHGQSSASPWIAAWSLTTGESAGSTNTLSLLSHTTSAPISWGVDATNRTQLDYAGMWHSQGYFDASGVDGQFVMYSVAGRLIPTNLTLSLTTSNFYATNIYTTNLYSSNAYITNLYVSNAYITNLTVQQITNVDVAYITNLYVENITNNTAYITNLYSSNAYITNITAKNLTVQNFYSQSNYLGEVTVTNGITNLSLTANTVLKADAGRQIASIPNGTGLLENDGAGVFSWNPTYATTDYVNQAVASIGVHIFSTSVTNTGDLAGKTNNWQGWLFVPPTAGTNSITALTSGAYIRNTASTNTFFRVEAGPIEVQAYLFRSGNPGGTITIHPEIYLYDTVSNTLPVELASAPPQTITATTPTLFTFSISSPGQSWTNPVKYVISWKMDSTPNAAAVLNFVNGGSYDSHATFIQSLANIEDLDVNVLVANTANITNLTVINSLTDLALTANTSLQTDGNKVITNEVSGVVVLSPGSHVLSGSNFFSGAVTGPTNSNNTTPDFSQTSGASLLVTNASFSFLAPINYDVTKKAQQWIEILVTNSTAADITITSPAGCATIGTPHCTNLTDVFVMYYPNVATNFYYIPCR